MFVRILDCVTADHNPSLVVVAITVALFSGFTFFRGPGSPFFCLVSLAMQSRSVLSPPRGRGLTASRPRLKKGSIWRGKVTEGFPNGKRPPHLWRNP